jgi:hypothetical protein
MRQVPKSQKVPAWDCLKTILTSIRCLPFAPRCSTSMGRIKLHWLARILALFPQMKNDHAPVTNCALNTWLPVPPRALRFLTLSQMTASFSSPANATTCDQL